MASNGETIMSVKLNRVRPMGKGVLMKSQWGGSLIEAVVALFVFSVGALGLAALQTATLVRSDDTKQRSLAIWKAQELADRIRATKSIDNPDGLIDDYVNQINSQVITPIGSAANSGGFTCPANPPTRCDEQRGGASVGNCSADQMVEFDVWSVLCDPDTGLSFASNATVPDGAVKLQDLDIALFEIGTHHELYIEWSARSAEKNTNLETTKIQTQLCGRNVDIDPTVAVYCLRLK